MITSSAKSGFFRAVVVVVVGSGFCNWRGKKFGWMMIWLILLLICSKWCITLIVLGLGDCVMCGISLATYWLVRVKSLN